MFLISSWLVRLVETNSGQTSSRVEALHSNQTLSQ
ncbi:Uncharacterised protein [Vibrio cholerae]|nr:Uncharacterised protein [Vibrio cholerae]